MSTNAGTVGVSARPTLLKAWTAAVSALALAALIMSAAALNLAARGDGSVSGRVIEESGITGTGAVAWDAGMLEAMEGRQLAETFRTTGPVLWDADKLAAMEGRQLAG